MTDDVAAVFRSAMRLADGFHLSDNMSFEDVPGWDSIGHMNLVSQLESHFKVTLDMDEIVGLDSVGAVRAIVARKRAG